MLNENYHIAVPTAFYNDETLNVEGTISHIKYLYRQGVRSVFVCGSTGEQHSLSLSEKIELLDAVNKNRELTSNMEIIFGVASIRQKEAELLAKHVSETNIAAIMIGYPPYIRPSQEEAFHYTKSLVTISGKYAILYNNPGRTGFDLQVDTINKLARMKEVIGIKEAGDKNKIEKLRIDSDKHFYIYAGGEQDLEANVKHGFNRLSSIAGNVAPIEIENWFEALLKGQDLEGQEKQKVENVLKRVYSGTPLINLREELNSQGAMLGTSRSPIGNQ